MKMSNIYNLKKNTQSCGREYLSKKNKYELKFLKCNLFKSSIKNIKTDKKYIFQLKFEKLNFNFS